MAIYIRDRKSLFCIDDQKLLDNVSVYIPKPCDESSGRLIDMDKLFNDEKIHYDISCNEEVYANGYTTSGNYWWIGTMSGYHEIKL